MTRRVGKTTGWSRQREARSYKDGAAAVILEGA